MVIFNMPIVYMSVNARNIIAYAHKKETRKMKIYMYILKKLVQCRTSNYSNLFYSNISSK